MFEKINYYGQSGDVYKACRPQVLASIQKNTLFLLKTMSVATAVLTILSLLGLHRSYLFLYLVPCLCSLVLARLLRERKRPVKAVMYLAMTLLLVFGIIDSAIDPHHVATAYLVFIVLTGILFMDTMINIIIYDFLIFAVFVGTSFYFKGAQIGLYDFFNGFIFTIVALILHNLVQKDKMVSFLILNKYNESQEQLKMQAYFDSLSGILNRSSFMKLLQQVIDEPHCDDLYLGFLDLDHFKSINDTYGHRVGDAAIVELAACLNKHLVVRYAHNPSLYETIDLNTDNATARLGGDEFLFAIHAPSAAICEAYLQELAGCYESKIIEANGQVVTNLHFSCGVLHYNNNYQDADALYQQVDQVMYEAKKQKDTRFLIKES